MHGTRFASPMLLQFICLLVNNNEDMDLTKRNVPRGEIYWRLLRCIYRKFCENKKLSYCEANFIDVLNKMGKFAFKIKELQSHCFQRDEVVRDVDENVFEYGFLVGYQDFRVIGDEKADVYVLFLHETVFRYLLMFHLSQRQMHAKIELRLEDDNLTGITHFTNEGSTVMNLCLLEADCLHFYLWFVSCRNTSFEGSIKTEIIKQPFVDIFNIRTLYWTELCKRYTAVDITEAQRQKDELIISFLESVFSECDEVENLYLGIDEPVGWVLRSLWHLRHKIKFVKITDPENMETYSLYSPRYVCSSRMKTVVIDAGAWSQMKHLFKFFTEPIALFVLVDIPFKRGGLLPLNVSTMVNPCLKQLHILGGYPACRAQRKCDMLEDLQCCAELTHLCFAKVGINRNIAQRLAWAMQSGFLPHLKHLSLEGCGIEDKTILTRLFMPVWPTLTHLDLKEIDLDWESLKESNFFFRYFGWLKLPKLKHLNVPMDMLRFLPPPFCQNLTCFWQHDVMMFANFMIDLINKGVMCNMNDLGLCFYQCPIKSGENFTARTIRLPRKAVKIILRRFCIKADLKQLHSQWHTNNVPSLYGNKKQISQKST